MHTTSDEAAAREYADAHHIFVTTMDLRKFKLELHVNFAMLRSPELHRSENRRSRATRRPRGASDDEENGDDQPERSGARRDQRSREGFDEEHDANSETVKQEDGLVQQEADRDTSTQLVFLGCDGSRHQFREYATSTAGPTQGTNRIVQQSSRGIRTFRPAN